MSDFAVYTLFSCSKGNCTYVKSGDSEILIDAGSGVKAIEKALARVGSALENISDIFITHDHTDHTHALECICKKYSARIHITERSAKVILKHDNGIISLRTQIHPTEYFCSVGDLEITSFQTPHDSAASVGYVIKTPEHSLAYATDIGYVSNNVEKNLRGCEFVIIEANHDVEMLTYGEYPEFLKSRILSRSGHLSNDDCAALAAHLAENGTKRFLLAHLSEHNNIPEIAFSSVACALGNMKSRGISLAVASPDEPTMLYDSRRR